MSYLFLLLLLPPTAQNEPIVEHANHHTENTQLVSAASATPPLAVTDDLVPPSAGHESIVKHANHKPEHAQTVSAAAVAPPRAVTEKNDDLILLAVHYAIIFVPIAGSPLLSPVVQGLVLALGAESIVHNEYPNWWLGTLAGLGVNAVSVASIGVGYGLLLHNLVNSRGPPSAVNVALPSGLLIAGAAGLLLEPLVFHVVSTIDGRALPGPGKGIGAE